MGPSLMNGSLGKLSVELEGKQEKVCTKTELEDN